MFIVFLFYCVFVLLNVCKKFFANYSFIQKLIKLFFIYDDETKNQMNGILDKQRINSSNLQLSDIDEKEQGAQGFVQKCVWKNKSAVMKTSNHIDFVIELEEEVWQNLKRLNSIHYCKVLAKTPVSPGERRFCLFFEEIKHNETEISLHYKKKIQKTSRNDSLAQLIYDAKHKPYALINCINQTLAAIAMFETLGITHYDLHADNVMITNTEYDVHVYKLNKNIVSIKTYGISPVIIDFGMAYLPNNRYNATCMFSNSGFTTFIPDQLVDARLLLTTAIKDLVYSIKNLKKTTISFPTATKIRRAHSGSVSLTSNSSKVSLGSSGTKSSDIVNLVERYIKKIKLMFVPLKLQDNGWFHDNCFSNIIDDIVNSVPKILLKRKSGIFKKNNFEWTLELMQHEITLPLKLDGKSTVGSFNEAILLFASEWVFVEQIIRNTKEEQLFLKELVSMDEEIKSFTKMRHRYPKIQNLNRLKNTIKNASIIFKEILIDKKMKIETKKKNMYSKLSFQTTEDILTSLPKPPIKYEDGMKLHFIDISKTHANSFTTTIDDAMARNLNNNEQEELVKFFI